MDEVLGSSCVGLMMDEAADSVASTSMGLVSASNVVAGRVDSGAEQGGGSGGCSDGGGLDKGMSCVRLLVSNSNFVIPSPVAGVEQVSSPRPW